MSKRILGVIPARLESVRFQRKVLSDILGKTMIQRVYERARKSKVLDDVIVATDSKEIIDSINSINGNAEMTSEKHRSGLDRVIEIAKRKNDYDFYINIQGDEPLIALETIEGIAKNLIEKAQCEVATAAIEFEHELDFKDLNQVKVVINNKSEALYFSRSPIPHGAFKNKIINPLKHIGLYGYSYNILLQIEKLEASSLEQSENLEQLRLLENDIKISVFKTSHDSIGVDTPEDLQKVIEIIKAKNAS